METMHNTRANIKKLTQVLDHMKGESPSSSPKALQPQNHDMFCSFRVEDSQVNPGNSQKKSAEQVEKQEHPELLPESENGLASHGTKLKA